MTVTNPSPEPEPLDPSAATRGPAIVPRDPASHGAHVFSMCVISEPGLYWARTYTVEIRELTRLLRTKSTMR